MLVETPLEIASTFNMERYTSNFWVKCLLSYALDLLVYHLWLSMLSSREWERGGRAERNDSGTICTSTDHWIWATVSVPHLRGKLLGEGSLEARACKIHHAGRNWGHWEISIQVLFSALSSEDPHLRECNPYERISIWMLSCHTWGFTVNHIHLTVAHESVLNGISISTKLALCDLFLSYPTDKIEPRSWRKEVKGQTKPPPCFAFAGGRE